jgi:AcrR family transcriptional regulator
VSYRRELLLAAMTAESASRGFAETTVARVAARARVSRAEFYRQFAGKEACFLAAFDELTQRTWSRVALASELLGPADADPPARLRAGIALLLDLAPAQPEAAKLCFVQARGAGVQAAERLDGALELFEQALLYRESSEFQAPDETITIVMGIVGGVYRVIYERLRSGAERELPGLVEEIVQWVLLYDDPSQTPRGSRQTARRARARASQKSAGDARPSAVGSSRRARLAAYDAGIERLLGAVEQPLRDAPDWPAGVRGALAAVAELLGGDPALLELLTVGIFTLGRAGRERDAQSLAAFAALLAPGQGLAAGEAPAPLVSELVAGGIWEVLRRHAVRGQGPRLPEHAGTLSFLALAPVIGLEAAARQCSDTLAR